MKQYEKMWEAARTYVLDIEVGNLLPFKEFYSKITGMKITDTFFYYENGVGGAYYNVEEMKNEEESGYQLFLDDVKYNKWVDKVNFLLDQVQKMEIAEPSKLSSEVLLKELTVRNLLTEEIFGYYLTCQPQCIRRLEKELEAQVGKENISLATMPTKKSEIAKEEYDWLNLLLDGSPQKLLEHSHKYRFCHSADRSGITHDGEFLTKFNEDKKLKKSEIRKKLKNIDSFWQNSFENKERVLQKLDPKMKAIAYKLSEIAYLRLEMRIRGWIPAVYFGNSLLEEISVRFSVPKDDIHFYTVEEINGLLTKKYVDVSKRKKGFLYALDGKKLVLYEGMEATKKFNSLVAKEDYSKISEIRGQIGNKGRVTGTVVQFLWSDNIAQKMSKFPKDGILVAGQTRPELVILMKKAKAIVTDEGGIISHAAIVSRELGIPCVIGTKIATKVLKDGNLIEVDANKGIVRIIK